MYATCLACTRSLGRNEALPTFPVGRRLAFDAARGRLWVVCRACGRWNLTPLEERWEAIADAERLVRGARLRVSTDEIGLARLPDGTELVRIGRAERRELAVWRYGELFARRRRRVWTASAASVALTGACVALQSAGPAAAGLVASLAMIGHTWWVGYDSAFRDHARVRVRDATGGPGRVIPLRRAQLWRATLHAAPHDGIAVRFRGRIGGRVELTGDAAVRAAGQLLRGINGAGASRRTVDDALDYLDDGRAGMDGRAILAHVARAQPVGNRIERWSEPPAGAFVGLPTPVRLALEMAVHEEAERLAMAGELDALRREWEEAEAVAAIADALLVPDAVEARLRRLRKS